MVGLEFAVTCQSILGGSCLGACMALPEQVITVTLSSWPCSGRALSHQGFHSVIFLETSLKAQTSTGAGVWGRAGSGAEIDTGQCEDPVREGLGFDGRPGEARDLWRLLETGVDSSL